MLLRFFKKKLRKEGFVFITYILCFYSVLFDFVVVVVIMRKKKDAFELFIWRDNSACYSTRSPVPLSFSRKLKKTFKCDLSTTRLSTII